MHACRSTLEDPTYLRIESAPQAYVWVNSVPGSEMGEPHTQEHLLLGKGDRGRRLGGVEAMSLGESSAFTDQWRTAYHFHTVAGPEAFWSVFDNQLDALLHPDYTDEEIRREVAHYGVSTDPSGALRLEEKGTVYNEMVRTYEQAGQLEWREAARLVYGDGHPLARESGGLPDDIRRMTPKDIRVFHARNYHLANMGMIGAFPSKLALATVLAAVDATLLRHAGPTGEVRSIASAPAPSPAPAGTIRVVDFPYQDDKSPGGLLLAWPGARGLELGDQMLLELFIAAIAGDESTSLYKLLIDSKTRTVDLGASEIWSWVGDDLSSPVFVGITKVAAAHLDEGGAERVRAIVAAELRRIAELPAGAPELVALAERVRSRLLEMRRELAKRLNSPPRFGFRGTGPAWGELLLSLERAPGFQKSLTFAPQLDEVARVLAEPGNPWAKRLERWGLVAAPSVVVTRPSPTERARLDAAREARLAAETTRLAQHYRVKDGAEALRRFAADYDATTQALEEAARAAPMPPLTKTLPMTLDDDLAWRDEKLGGVPVVRSTFAGTTSGTVGIALRLDGVPAHLQPFLALLPDLLTQAGVIVDGTPIPADEVVERQRREVLGLRAWITKSTRSGRVELAIEGQGLDAEETRRAIAWIARFLHAPDWRGENLLRLRDLVDRNAQALRAVMQGAEERWATDPRDALARQTWPVYAHAASFLTAAHDAHRVRWMLRDPGDASARDAAAKYLDSLAPVGAKLGRKDLVALAAALAVPPAKPDAALAKRLPGAAMLPAARAVIADAGRDLTLLLPELPEESLGGDWAYLCRQMAADLRRGVSATLAALAELRELVVRAGGARLWIIGSAETQAAIEKDVGRLATSLGTAPAPTRVPDGPRFVEARLRERLPAAAAGARPTYLGLLNPSTQSGVFVHAAPGPSYLDRAEGALLDYLASNLYAGHGAHGLFVKTWAAGLAYSNGIRVSQADGILQYYAERCPELPQTMRFVLGELGNVKADPSLVSYALAQAFSSRVADTYERRGRAIADDLADGVTPETVRALREGLLALRSRNDLAGELFGRLAGVYARVLPGYGPGWAPASDAVYLVIGPKKQLDAWQMYLTSAVGPDARLFRLTPRDFWLPDPAVTGAR